MLFRLNMVDLPILIGNIENQEERQQLVRMLAQGNMTLEDVDVVSIDQAEERGLFENERFQQYIRRMGFENAEQMREAAELARQRGGGNAIQEENRNQNENQPEAGGENLLEGWQ